ncbi:hypothetical protein D3C84_683400 [compost metagenome]
MLAGGVDTDQFRFAAERADPLRQGPTGADPALWQLGRCGVVADEKSGTERSNAGTQAHKQLPLMVFPGIEVTGQVSSASGTCTRRAKRPFDNCLHLNVKLGHIQSRAAALEDRHEVSLRRR